MVEELLSGNDLLAESLRAVGADRCFFIMGGPTVDAANAMEKSDIQMVGVRHEQAAVMMAQAAARLTLRPGLAMACSGPGTTNTITGVAHAFVDGAPVVVLGGSSPVSEYGHGFFQELDQLKLMEPITRWSTRIYHTHRIPEIIARAFNRALGPKPGPVYVDLPADVLYGRVTREQVAPLVHYAETPRPHADPAAVAEAAQLLAAAQRPVLVAGNGALSSASADVLGRWTEATGCPVFTNPQARGLVPEDGDFSFLEARSTAFREADLIILAGTRVNYVVSQLLPPRFSAEAKVVQIDISAEEIATSRRVNVPLIGDAAAVLTQLLDAYVGLAAGQGHDAWIDHLGDVTRTKRTHIAERESKRRDELPIHPLTLCEVLDEFIDRDAILCVDGQEILNYARQRIRTHVPGHRLNSGVLGTMGVGLPFGVGAKLTKPDTQVVVLHGDGSFGLNGMEFDTAVRFGAAVLTVISNNGGWTATDKYKAGRELGYTRYDKVAEALGGHGEFVEKYSEIRPALERAVASGVPAVVNVMTDSTARAGGAQFTKFET